MQTTPLVISLTSIPPRFGQLPRVVAALRAQTARPARILVTLPRHYRRFPGSHAAPALPGAEVVRPARDMGPAAKVLAAARLLRGQDCHLLYCDDDWLYHPRWAEGFLATARARPGCAIAASGFSARRLGLSPAPHLPDGEAGGGYVDIAQGFAGVLLRPDWLDAPPAVAQAWAVDDIWLSAQYARAGRRIWKQPGLRGHATPLADPGRLQDAVIDGRDRDAANRAAAQAMARAYGIWQAASA